MAAFKEPEHEDYQALDAIVLEYFAKPQSEPDYDVKAALATVVDPTSAVYVAIGRATAYLGISNGQEMQARLQEVMSLALFWSEGLHAGVLLERWRD